MFEINNVINQTKYEELIQTISDLDAKGCRRAFVDEETGIVTYPFEKTWVGDVLRGPQFCLANDVPIFICAQTGAGKSYWIFHHMLPRLKNRGKKLLILSSRSALKNKYKYDAMDAEEIDRELYTEKRIQKEHHFGDVDVFAYQEFALEKYVSNEKDLRWKEYGAIVLDEVHFFVEDSDFNVSTEFIFQYLLQHAKAEGIPRIYMTATADNVFSGIYEVEKNLGRSERNIYQMLHQEHKKNTFQLFHFDRDFSQYVLRELEGKPFDLIKNSSDEQQWLVFVRKGADGEKLEKELEKNGIRSVFLDSDRLHSLENQSESFQKVIREIVDNERLMPECKVLIATKCLDVGVCINNENLAIINELTEKAAFLQALGRKRIKKNSEKVPVYIPGYDKKTISCFKNETEKNLREFSKNIKFFPQGKVACGGKFPEPVYVYNGKYNFNGFAFLKLNALTRQYKKMLAYLDEGKDIIKYIASWMPKCRVMNEEGKDSTQNEIWNAIEPFTHRHKFGEGEFIEICKQLADYDSRTDVRSSRKMMSTQTVNKILAEHGIECRLQKRNGVYSWSELGGIVNE